MNREAYRILETSLEKGKSNIGKNLNASHIGESALMQENTDYGVIVNKEEFEGVEYLTFKLIASRAKKPSITYFAHPFEKGNGLRLMDDIHLAKSLSEDKIGGDKFKEFNPNKARENKGSFFNNNNSNQPEFPPVDLKVEANNGIEKDSGIPF
ncbi:putative DnaB-like replicative helicase [Bacillus phage vB_BspM_Internexus]|nr:putative DnaB-like replicative helicase [Bacillus phage vB_BspM_Internexus]